MFEKHIRILRALLMSKIPVILNLKTMHTKLVSAVEYENSINYVLENYATI